MASPVWNKNVPQSSEFGSNWPQESQQNLEYLEEALGLEHTFPGSIGPPQTAGKHRQATQTLTGTARVATAAEIATGALDTVMITPLGLQTGVSGAGQTKYGKLKVHNNSGAPATKINLTASALILTDGGSPAVPFRVENVSLAIDGTVNGANGLDTGSLASHWYFVYAIAKADGTVAGLLSLSATAPTLPTDYIYFGLFSTAYYAATITYANGDTTPTGFYRIIQYGNRVNYVGKLLSMFSVSYVVYTSTDITTYVPPIALTVIIQAYGASGYETIELAWDNTPANECKLPTVVYYSGGLAVQAPFPYVLNPAAPQTLFVNGGGGAYLKGYELDI